MYHIRLLLKTTIIMIMTLWLSLHQGWSHECIPASNSAEDIFIYNSCKSDLLTGASGHDKASAEATIEALEQENAMLKAQISTLKARLLQIIAEY